MTLPQWRHHRVVHSRYPPINLFDTVKDADALLLAELEGETSQRLMRWRECVSAEDARFGDGWGPVMASFCYIRAGRFNTDDFGCYYAASTLHTALKEWSFHAGRTWRDFGYQDHAHAVVRCYTGQVRLALDDLTNNPAVHDPDSYEHSQALGIKLRSDKSHGILYQSVRHDDGLCIGLFRPPATSPVTQAGHYTVKWDGLRFTEYARLGTLHAL